MKPLVSVIVATYRRDEALKNALCSLKQQSYLPIEIIVVDDNDDAQWNTQVESIVEELKNTSPSITLRYIANHPNQGSANTRNKGIFSANGLYVTFLDDDDIYLPEKIEKQVLFMEKEGLDFSITDLCLYNENDKLVDKRTRGYLNGASDKDLFENHLKYHLTGTDTLMFRTEYIKKIGGFPPIDVGDEFYLMQRAIENGGRFGYLPECHVKAYVHTGEGGLSSGQGKIDGENALYEHKKKYFHLLSKKTVKYIKARHFAVLAYAQLRMKNIGSFFKNTVFGFFSAPVMFCRILLNR